MTGWVHPAWAILGIEPTDDTRAIRVAYSAKLKAIDPEGDPMAFVALREAFDAARAEAQRGQDDDTPAEVEWRIEREGEPELDWTRFEPARDAPPGAPVSETEQHQIALARLLHAPDGAFGLSPVEEAEAFGHWRAILADPRMEDVGYFADVERWASELIASTPRRSAGLVIHAAEHFRWTARDGTVSQSPAVAEVNRRYRLQQFILAAQKPGHSHYGALAELVTPAYPRSDRGRVDPLTVFELLAIVRDAWPEMETRFDANRVEMWRHNTADPDSPESRAAREGRPSWILWIWLGWWGLAALITIINAIGSKV